MNKQEILLLSLSGGYKFSPVQVQKLLFLVDKNLPSTAGAPFFNFQPYDYGPFDKDIYLELEKLSKDGLVEIYHDTFLSHRLYALTPQGCKKAQELTEKFDEKNVDYIKKLSEFVRGLSFRDLVSAIYKAYPETKVNSVFAES
ncbi:MAG: hypothetical protein ACKO43_04475 [Alphaproteobacteria bacterium]